MRTHAIARFVRVPPRKARLVLDAIRGKPVGEALATLEYTPRAAARLIEKVLRSAIANAEHNHQVRNLDDLRVVEAIADGGPSMKRVSPRAMGRASHPGLLLLATRDDVPVGRPRPPAAEAAPKAAPAPRAAPAPVRPAAKAAARALAPKKKRARAKPAKETK